MATAKKKPVRKVAPTKKRTSSKKAKSTEPVYQSFQVAKNPPALLTFKITRQTIYWIIILLVLIVSQLWIIKLQVEVGQLIEAQRQQMLEDI